MVSMNTNVLRDDKVARQPPNRAVERTAGSPSLAAAAHRRRLGFGTTVKSRSAPVQAGVKKAKHGVQGAR